MTASSSFDRAHFEQLLDVYGAKLERWPAELRPRASEWLASSAEAQLAWARAAQFEALLDAVPDLLPSAELSARIAALPVRRPQGWAAWWPFGNPLAPLLGWGAAAAFGLFIGSGLMPSLQAVGDAVTGDAVTGDAVTGDAVADPVSSGADDSVGQDPAGNDVQNRDEAQADDWSDLELALGLGSDWEEEP